MKKLILMVIDAFASRVFVPALNRGQLPHLQALVELGQLNTNCIGIFPTLTPAATSSIVTGYYPQKHHVLGFHWYDIEHDTVVYYGDDFWIIWREGFGEFFEDFLNKLNHERLQVPTLFQLAEQRGLKAGVLNYLIFRGNVKHDAHVPLAFSWIPSIPTSEKVLGPSLMYFGDFVDTEIKKLADTLDRTGGPFHRFGFDDENTGNLLVQFAKQRAFPGLTVAYFPDNDFHSHEVGPAQAVGSLQDVDAQLGHLFALFGGVEAFLNEFSVVITGDHSQTDVVSGNREARIELDRILDDFAIADPGRPWRKNDEIIICPDMRAAQIYFNRLEPTRFNDAIEALLPDTRVDQVIWRAHDLASNETGYKVATRDRGRLHFWPGQDGPETGLDQFGGRWSWRGSLAVFDGQVKPNNELAFPTYPNAFERVKGGLDCRNSGHLWVTAQPGYEFALSETSVHVGGGSHGSLHAGDSLSPLIVAGAPQPVHLPDQVRTIDVTPLCLNLLGLEFAYPIGASRVTN